MISIINAKIVNEGHVLKGCLKIKDGRIQEVAFAGTKFEPEGEIIDAQGSWLLPGVIDEHVHLREPGLTDKADILSESRAAAAGGVTTFFDMPNTKPQTTTLEALEAKLQLASEKSLVNYACYLGATNDNLAELEAADPSRIPAIKLFMGASTGNMLVEKDESLRAVFALGRRRNLPIVTHCEDSAIIACNEARLRAEFGDKAPVELHPVIRDAEVCLSSTRKAIALAKESGARLLVAHVSTAQELEEIHASGPNVSAEGCVQYFYFSDQDYATLGGRIKCNPAIKTLADRQALLQGLKTGHFLSVATDHAPHLIAQKQGGVFEATSGMPSVQFSLPLMLQLTESGLLSVADVATLVSHNPARYFGVKDRGFIREGLKADFVLVSRQAEPHTITDTDVLSKCRWTPYIGQQLNWQVESTFVNGQKVFDRTEGFPCPAFRGEAVEFQH